MTIPNVTPGTVISSSAWGNEVADQLNNLPLAIQSGRDNISINGSGIGTITFPAEFDSAPTVVATVQLSTSTQRTVQINSGTTTSVEIRCFVDGDDETSVSRLVHWIAIGVLA